MKKRVIEKKRKVENIREGGQKEMTRKYLKKRWMEIRQTGRV